MVMRLTSVAGQCLAKSMQPNEDLTFESQLTYSSLSMMTIKASGMSFIDNHVSIPPRTEFFQEVEEFPQRGQVSLHTVYCLDSDENTPTAICKELITSNAGRKHFSQICNRIMGKWQRSPCARQSHAIMHTCVY
jgi:hypothetical protein